MFRCIAIVLTVLFALVAVLASPTNAATISLGLISKQLASHDAAGEWELWAWTSSGDNDGLSGYGIELVGNGIAGQHTSPVWIWSGPNTFMSGFTAGRAAIPDAEMGTTLFAAQNSLSLDIFYGVGSPDVPSRIAPPTFWPPPAHLNQEWWLNPAFQSSPSGDNPFSVPAAAVQLAEGISSDYLTVEFGARTDVNVFTSDQASQFGTEIELGQASLFLDRLPAAPEPDAILIFAILISFMVVRPMDPSFMRNTR